MSLKIVSVLSVFCLMTRPEEYQSINRTKWKSLRTASEGLSISAVSGDCALRHSFASSVRTSLERWRVVSQIDFRRTLRQLSDSEAVKLMINVINTYLLVIKLWTKLFDTKTNHKNNLISIELKWCQVFCKLIIL